MKIYTTFILLFISFISFSQINKNGIPFITNYTPEQYQASEQNWAIVQDHRGVMYFGNNDHGILEYDGSNWRKIPISNNSIVRSLTINSKGQIYVGAVNDFGVLKPSKKGKLQYKSLRHLIKDSTIQFSDVWKSYNLNDTIYFSSREYIFEYSKQKLKIIELPQLTLFSFLIDNTIYIGNFLEGLMYYDNGIFKKLTKDSKLEKKGIYTLNKLNNSLIIGSIPYGLYSIENKQYVNSEFNKTQASNFLKENQVYYGTNLNNNEILFSSLQKGAISINEKGKIISHYTKSNGLQNETITFSYLDNRNNIWLGLNIGLAKLESNSPFRLFNDNNGLAGSVLDICEYQNKLYVATSSGLYYKGANSKNTTQFKLVEGIKDQTWSLLPLNQNGNRTLLIGTIRGLYELNTENKLSYIDPQVRSENTKEGTNYIQKIYQNPNLSDEIYVGLINGLFSIKKEKGKWQRYKEYAVNESDIRSIIRTKNELWVGTNFKGIIKFNLNTESSERYTTEHGLPSNNGIYIQEINKSLIFGTSAGIMKFNSDSNKFEPYNKFSALKKHNIFRIYENNSNELWISKGFKNKQSIERIYINKYPYRRDTIPFKRLPNIQIDAFYNDQSGITWLGCSKGLYSFDSNKISDRKVSYNSLIRKVVTSNDSILFYGTNFNVDNNDTTISVNQNKINQPSLNYLSNDIIFEYTSPYFIQEKKNLYSYILEGNDNKWSKWSNETKAVFTNLHEGKYNFKVKAKNIYGIESSVASYEFTIKPPWYRTIIAYLIYTIIGIVLIYLIVKLYTRRLEQEKIRLEGIVRERTAEIREQKEEIEQQAEDLKEANIVLTEQKEEISKQKEEITASIKYAERIQKAVVPNEEKAACLLKDYFLLWQPRDIVSGDFWWLSEKDNQIIVAAADCTGHGVPGAFMSMLGVSFLNEIVNQQDHTESHKILNHLRHKVKTTLGQTGKDGEAKDGMDIALLVIDFKKQQLQFSGAYNPLLLIRNNELITYKADRNPIGIYIKEKDSFTQNIVELQKGDTLYIFSDGYVDQFGGPDKMKFTSKRFKQLLLDVQDKSMPEQKDILNHEINLWKGETEQIDDIIVLGIKI